VSDMYIYDESEQALSPFFLISILLHVLLFILYPYLAWDLSIGHPSLEHGGVVQVINVSAPQPAQPRGTPQAVRPSPPPQPQPKPEPTPPKPQEPAAKQQAEQPQPPKVDKPVEVKEEPPTREVVPEPEERPKVEPPVEEKPPTPAETPTTAERTGEQELLTSDRGTEVPLVDTQARPEQAPTPPVQPPPAQPSQEIQEAKATEERVEEADPQPDTSVPGDGGATETPKGREEPELGPPPSGSDMWHAGGVPVYPKNAQHEGVTGRVELLVHVDERGRISQVEIASPSSDSRLDQVARRTIAESWAFRSAPRPYKVKVTIVFDKREDPISGEAYHVDVHFEDIEYVL